LSPRKTIPDSKKMPPVSMSIADMEWNKTGNWTFLKPLHTDRIAPCVIDCPLSVPINRYMHLVKNGDYHEAWKLIVSANPLPAVTGRVCYHSCESGCNREELDEVLNIHGIERFLGDTAIDEGWRLDPPQEELEGLPVAILGSGPAGLGCAYGLRKNGYQVIVYERETSPGGMLRVGVPQFRMPRKLLDAEIARLESIGVEFRCGEQIDDLERISRDVRAVFLASGAHGSRDPQIEGADCAGIYFGLELLKKYNSGVAIETGGRVAVVGGGNTAIDVARASIRLGAKVDLYYRRTKEEMPAHPEELDEARQEGVSFHFQMAPTRIEVGSNGHVGRVKLIRMRQGEKDESSRARPIPLAGSDFSMDADSVVFAIGEQPELGYLKGRGSRDGNRLAVDALCRTSISGVFAGGDIIPGENSVSHALADGIAAANNMHLLFQSYDPLAETGETSEPVEPNMINFDYFLTAPRQKGRFSMEKTPHGNSEAEETLAEQQVLEESSRCFNCGTCVDCDICLVFCPDLAIYFQGGNYMVKTDYCKGCGICAEECPRGVISMEKKN